MAVMTGDTAERVDEVGRGVKQGPQGKETKAEASYHLPGLAHGECNHAWGAIPPPLVLDPSAGAVLYVTDQGWLLGHYPPGCGGSWVETKVP